MTKPAKISYALMALTLLLVGGLHLASPFLTVLFSFFALQQMQFFGKKWIAITLYIVLVFGFFYCLIFFVNRAVVAFPDILDSLMPLVMQRAQDYGIHLPFNDWESLRAVALKTIQEDWLDLGNYAKNFTRQVAFLAIGMVVGVSLFLNSKVDLARDTHFVKNNLYSLTTDEMVLRFQTFYRSFATVMGAQIAISAINTALTSIFLMSVDMPYPRFLIILTFLCGLLPIVGNVISNTFIVSVALTVSWKLALASLVFLVVVHKLEYFLNSKIVGDRIKNPMWLTLLGLVVGERLMGIPGMILAPVVLHYIKLEASKREVVDSRHAEKERQTVF